MEELTEAKWVLRVLRVLVIEAGSELKEDQISEGEVEEVANFSLFQIAEG